MADPLHLTRADPDHVALVEGDRTISYRELSDLVDRRALELRQTGDGLIALGMTTSLESIVTYLAALACERPILLLDPTASDEMLANISALYRPVLVEGYAPGLRTGSEPTGATGALVLLTTSGSTGSPKLVRLHSTAIVANAESIAAALDISPDERAPLSLPLFYSYGLSVLNSHLCAGATAVITPHSVVAREFWHAFDQAGCTSFAGVPYTYNLLRRMRLEPADHPSLRILTQAGGNLDVSSRTHFHTAMSEVGGRFVVMYGQTEATARMSVLPHEHFAGREASVGWAVPGGSFAVNTDAGETSDADIEGEVVYYGPNVMLGYASSAADVGHHDDQVGRLLTGDRGRLDKDGVLWLTGRDKRITKIFGTRVNLDDVEGIARDLGFVAAALSGEDRLLLIVEGETDRVALSKELAARLRVHRSGVAIEVTERLPLLPNGKTDYITLTTQYR